MRLWESYSLLVAVVTGMSMSEPHSASYIQSGCSRTDPEQAELHSWARLSPPSVQKIENTRVTPNQLHPAGEKLLPPSHTHTPPLQTNHSWSIRSSLHNSQAVQ